MEEKQLKRYRRSLKRTRAKSRNPSVEENEKEGRRPVEGGEKVDGRRLALPLAKAPSSSGDTSPTSKEGPRPAKPPANELKPPAAVDVIVTQEEEDVEQTIPVLSTDTPTSDQEPQSLEAASTEVEAAVSVIVTEDLEKAPEQESKPPVDVIVTETAEDQETTNLSSASEKPISQEESTESAKAVETPEPIKVIVTQEEEEEEEEAVKKTNEDIVRLEELAVKAKTLASWIRAVSPARKPVAVTEEKTTNKSEGAAVVEEAEEHEIVASDNLKVIDPAAAQVLAGGKAAEEDTADSKTAAADVKVEKPAVEETTDVKVEVGRSNTEETAGNEEEFNFEESLGWTAVQGRKGRKGKKGLSKLKGIISELKAEEGEKKEVIEEPKVPSFEEVEKKKVIEEPKVLSFEEAAKQVEAESAFAKKTFAVPQGVEVKEDVDTDSSGWEVIEVSDESEDEVKEVAEVTEEVKERMSEEEKGCSSQRWVEEMNEKNRKKMELENKAT